MNIILGDKNAQEISSRHTVLELDRFTFADQEESAWCVIEKLTLDEFETNAERVALHGALIEDYRGQRWKECLSKIDCLRGSWGGEMDSFYDEIESRLAKFQQDPPDQSWDYRIAK